MQWEATALVMDLKSKGSGVRLRLFSLPGLPPVWYNDGRLDSCGPRRMNWPDKEATFPFGGRKKNGGAFTCEKRSAKFRSRSVIGTARVWERKAWNFPDAALDGTAVMALEAEAMAAKEGR